MLRKGYTQVPTRPERIHCRKRLTLFPSPAGMSLTKLSLVGNNLIIPAWERLFSDNPARDGKIGNLFYSVILGRDLKLEHKCSGILGKETFMDPIFGLSSMVFYISSCLLCLYCSSLPSHVSILGAPPPPPPSSMPYGPNTHEIFSQGETVSCTNAHHNLHHDITYLYYTFLINTIGKYKYSVTE